MNAKIGLVPVEDRDAETNDRSTSSTWNPIVEHRSTALSLSYLNNLVTMAASTTAKASAPASTLVLVSRHKKPIDCGNLSKDSTWCAGEP
jgi:hypothetical protein